MTASFLTSPSYDFNLFEKKVKKWYKAAPRRQNPEVQKINNKYKLRKIFETVTRGAIVVHIVYNFC